MGSSRGIRVSVSSPTAGVICGCFIPVVISAANLSHLMYFDTDILQQGVGSGYT